MSDWTPTESAFRQFLLWLDEGVESDGAKYLEMRRRLVLYFDRKKCLLPDELADETLGRVAQKLQEQGEITNLSPAHYCYVVARFVFLEYLRRVEHSQANLDAIPGASSDPSVQDGSSASQEKLLDRLDRCLERLTAEDRELILKYYEGDGRTKIEARRKLAERLGLSPNALTIRACRIRNKVESCVKTGLSEP